MSDPARREDNAALGHPPGRVLAIDVRTFTLGARVLAYSKRTRSSVLLSQEQAKVLSLCRGAATVEEHASRIASVAARPGFEVAELFQLITHLSEKGMLVPEDSLLELSGEPNEPLRSVTPIHSLVIITSDRPQALLRAVRSYSENLDRWRRGTALWVIDDSHRADLPAALRRGLLEETRSAQIELWYIGRAGRRRLAAEIARLAKLPRPVVEFGLCCKKRDQPFTAGSARNTALVATAGQRFVMVDDDSVCRMFSAQNTHASRVSVRGWGRGDSDLGRYTPYLTLKEALESFEEVQADFVGLHERVLGSPCAGGLPADWGTDVQFEGPLSWRYAHDGLGNPRTVVSTLGLIGDCATDWSGNLLLRASPALEEVARNGGCSVEEYLVGRQVAACVENLTIWNGPEFSTFNVGLDNRLALPPFLPLDRGEDFVYGYQLKACVPSSLTALQPLMLLHVPIPARTSREWWQFEELVRPALAAYKFVVMYDYSSKLQAADQRDPAIATAELGRFIERWAGLNPTHFADEVAQFLWRSGSAIAGKLEQGARLGPPPLRRAFEKARDHVTEVYSSLHVPSADSDGIEAARWRVVRERCRDFGVLLQAWPEIVYTGSSLLSNSPSTFAEHLR